MHVSFFFSSNLLFIVVGIPVSSSSLHDYSVVAKLSVVAAHN
jgi:hypothetical protein